MKPASKSEKKYKDKRLFVFSFYRFVKIKNKIKIKEKLEKFFSNKVVRGTVLIADEGINSSISGKENDLLGAMKEIRLLLRIRKIDIKINEITHLPFNKMKVRLKKEIVSLGIKKLKVKTSKENFIHPSNWDELIQKKNIKLIDARNIYETAIGGFKGCLDPKTNSFRSFPKKIKKLNISKKDQIAMYCTGGIRCEKASEYLSSIGYKSIMQLEGGIINYLEFKKNSNENITWWGECFVFDNRVAINKKLKKGNFIQCYGCRRPIKLSDTKSKN